MNKGGGSFIWSEPGIVLSSRLHWVLRGTLVDTPGAYPDESNSENMRLKPNHMRSIWKIWRHLALNKNNTELEKLTMDFKINGATIRFKNWAYMHVSWKLHIRVQYFLQCPNKNAAFKWHKISSSLGVINQKNRRSLIRNINSIY